MSELVVFDGFSLLPQGPTLTYSVSPGHSVAIVGPSGSGKTRLIRCLKSKERAGQGRVAVLDNWVEAGTEGLSRRSTPQSIVRKIAGRRAGDASHALTMAGLWEQREAAFDNLTEGQQRACELLAPLASNDPVIFVDGQLDALDPWSRSSAVNGLRERVRKGACLIAATNRLELCAEFDWIIIMHGSRVAFAGSIEELYRQAGESTVTVETRNQQGVRALVEPFEISILSDEDGLVMKANEGQAIAAKLLMEGYGDVKSVILKQPTIEDAVRRIVGRA